MVEPDRAGNAFNVAGNPAGDQTWELDARNILVRVDHSFSPNFRISDSFYWNRRPSIRNCGGVGGCTTEFSGETEPEKNNTYIGEGFYQRISTHHAHTAVRLDHPQQPGEPLDGRLGPLVHGWEFVVGRCRLAAAAVGRQPGRSPGQHRRTARVHLRRQHPLQHRRAELAELRVREERSLAVLERPDVGEGPAHREVRVRVSPSHVPEPRLGDEHRRAVQLQSLDDRRL